MTRFLDIVSMVMPFSCAISQQISPKYKRTRRMILLLVLMFFLKVSHGLSCGDSVLSSVENPRNGVCGDMDVRNSVKNFRMLENCTVIEGSLHISLMDYVPQEEYNKYSFPLLQEITGHFMMFRVFGLRSLRNIFPNLAVIRGQTKFFNDYALVAYEMRDLEELGLVGLTLINGSVRLTKNHKLCHISSIDWGKLTPGVDPSKHLFLDNREEQLCPDFCNESCPSTLYQGNIRRRCWTSKADDCQRNLVCRCPNGESCAPDGSCCNENCIGGCSGPSASDCYVCSKVVYMNKCQSSCPLNTYMLSNRRCLDESECLDLLSHSAHGNRSDNSDNFPKILRGDNTTPNQCVFKCPPDYKVNDKKYQHAECIRCNGRCPKVCNTTIVSSIEDSEKLFGCSKIDGSLEIQITGGKNIDYRLTKNLEEIREITGYVKIWKSYPLLTLHFFRRLDIIGGDKLMNKGYSLFVADNTNLQEIFPEEQMKKMVIRKGTIGFHGNRKLCLSKIVSFSEQLNVTSQLSEERIDISNTSNGNLIPCANMFINLTVNFVGEHIVIGWAKYKASDSRQLTNYIVNYKEIQEPVRDIFQGRDACSDNDWTTKAVKPSENPNITLLKMKHLTKYAVYVRASTLPSATVSAVSRIIYIETDPSSPSAPRDLKVTSSDPHQLTIKWNPPMNPNGNVTHYKITYQLLSNTDGFEQRDFCKGPTDSNKDAQKVKAKKALIEEKDEKETEHAPLPCCDCPISQEEQMKQNHIKELEINLENELHMRAFYKKWPKNCVTTNKSISFSDGSQNDTENSSNSGFDFNNPIISSKRLKNVNKNGTFDKINANASNINTTAKDPSKSETFFKIDETVSSISTTESFSSNLKQEVIVYDTVVTLSNLEHYHSYVITVAACHEVDSAGLKLCSNSTNITEQTAANPTADNLNSSLVVVEPVVNKSGEVHIKWEPPLFPNGLILKYYIKYMKIELDRNSNPVVVCVSTKQFQNNTNGYLLSGLLPGNYSLQIIAHSQAGNGTYTQEVFFFVSSKYGEETDSLSLIIGICSGVAVLIILILVAVYFYQKYRYVDPDVIVSQNPHYIPTDQLYAADEWEVPRDTIYFTKELGQGSFGTVFEGIMEDPEMKNSIPVAIKTVNDKADFHERLKILKEATTMKVFECHHVVKLLGVVSKGQPALVIMELMGLGDLRNYLRRCRLDPEDNSGFTPPTNEQIHQMAGEIADGMAYLSDKKIVHRDLAARNCLVANDRTVKIADFGMARDVYMTEYYRKDQKALLPVRWMAPESLKDGIFTTMSDIWSYGIVLWEMVTLAEQPYQGLGNDEVLHFVTEGHVINAPKGCPEDLSNMMKRCWNFEPKDRPTFKSLLELLVPYLNEKFHRVSYFFSEVVSSDAERVEKIIEGNVEQLKIENERDEGQDFNKVDSFVENSPASNDEALEHGVEDIHCTTHVTQSFGSLPREENLHTNQKEPYLLIQHHNMQVPFLYPSSFTTGNVTKPGNFYSHDDDDDIDSDNDFITKDDKNYIRPSKDAKSSSERLKLLSNSPDNSQLKLEMMPVKPSPFAIKPGDSGRVDEYEVMSPVTAGLSKVCDEKILLSSPSVQSHPGVPSVAVSNQPPFSFTNQLPSVATSASPILHVDMEGIENIHGTSKKQQQSTANLLGHEDGESSWLFQNNNPVSKSNARNSHMRLSECSSNSNSNSNSIKSDSEGSKDSSSSSESHNSFNSGTANGHGPFTHQQAAMC